MKFCALDEWEMKKFGTGTGWGWVASRLREIPDRARVMPDKGYGGASWFANQLRFWNEVDERHRSLTPAVLIAGATFTT